MEIVGFNHDSERVEKAVVEYIDSSYPILEKIMLELPNLYKFPKLRQKNNGPFGRLESHFNKRSRIIYGDPNIFSVLGLTIREADKLARKNPEELNRRIDQAHTTVGFYKSVLNGTMLQEREEEMEKYLINEKPEVSVMGFCHAVNLKIKHPKISLTYVNQKWNPRHWFRNSVISRFADKTILV